jgi:hypothetical protein
LAERPFCGGDRPDLVSVERLRQIADRWGKGGAHFAAGYALSQRVTYAWGDVDAMASCLAAAVREFQAAITAPGTSALEQAASLWMCLVEFGMARGILFDYAVQSAIYRRLQSDLAQVLSMLGNNAQDLSARLGFLVRGCILTTDFEGNWSAKFPEIEIHGQVRSGGGDQLTLYLESAFQYFIDSGDYVAANSIACRYPEAFTALGRIPLVGPDVVSAITPMVAQRTFAGFFGGDRSWMHRTIGSIRDERTLQRLILRLMQGRLPLYAQIRQGPLEYGKDIAVLVEDNGLAVLQMYQVKVRNITVPVWRTARAELEEIFQVELPKVQLSTEPDRREGILIFNGHLNPSVEGPVSGWLDEQRRDHGRSFSIMHLDAIVDWVMRKGLVGELRSALNELGIAVVGESR